MDSNRNCKFSFYTENISFDIGPIQYVALRRNVIADAYSTNSHSQGIYADHVRRMLLEENVIDHNGWNESVNFASATIFNHNIYLQLPGSDPKSTQRSRHPEG